jgi:hypothetical protein
VKIDDELIEATALVVARKVYGQLEADAQDREVARRILSEVAWKIAKAERKRIAALIDPRKLELLATYLDVRDDEAGPSVTRQSREVQRDLRQWAGVLRGQDPAPASVTEVLIEAAAAIGAVEPA